MKPTKESNVARGRTVYESDQYKVRINNDWYGIVKAIHITNILTGCENYNGMFCMDLTIKQVLNNEHCNHCVCNVCLDVTEADRKGESNGV